ncbi:PAS domain S-box protein [Methanolobus halotolerans]|uniref:histidine kinase n=1 Tax=Methanolobus halotolerans TaxID=2052935 RepID=A0A4E0QB90_9EURY|nr:PAS domain S-box protein [Methanolobus halotolerans]TGC09804.1 hypothetical protein CUN85_05475 [Methanolobus halotolerans]
MLEQYRSRILVVDDDPVNVRLVEAQLVNEYDIVTAFSGEEALKVLAQEKPDLIILDVMMPGINGYETCRHIKSSKETCFIVIIVTALSSRDDRLEGIRAGADDFLAKPIDRVELITRVRNLLKSKKLHDKLIAESERAKKYLEVAGSMIVALDVHGTVVLANAKCCEVLGYAGSELIGSNWFSKIILPEHRQDMLCYFNRILEDGPESVEYSESYILTRSGSKKLISWQNSCMKDSSGKITTVLGSGSDITEQRNTGQKIKESEEKFRALFENSVDSVMILNSDGIILEANHAACKMLGYSREEILLMSGSDLITPELRDKCMENAARLMEKGQDMFETIYVRKDSSRVPVEINVKLIDYNKETAILSNGRDITERKLAERNLKKSEEKFRLLAENANDVIWTMDKHCRFLYISPSVMKLRGYTPEEARNQVFGEAFTPDSIMKIESAVNSFFADMQPGEMQNHSEVLEIGQFHRNGHVVWTEAVARAVFSNDGEFQFFLGVTRDISERKKAEEAIHKYTRDLSKANEALKSLDRMKDEFISNLSHELKTPLISIKGYSELVHDEVLGPLIKNRRMPCT